MLDHYYVRPKTADRIRALIARGQVSICNHTWDHKDLTKLDPDHIRTELTRNEVWIEQTFGVSARPLIRPLRQPQPHPGRRCRPAVVDRFPGRRGRHPIVEPQPPR